MGVTINGTGRVFAKEHDNWTSYTLGVSSKDTAGNWIRAYQMIRFKNGESVPNGTDIEFNAFPVVKARTVDGQQRNYILWQILNYTVIEKEPEAVEAPQGFSALESADVPF